jgi:hypothetical protein
MTLADRFHDWVEGRIVAWKDRLRGWMVSWAVKGITDALEDMTPEQKVSVNTIIDRLRDDPNTPAFLKPFLEGTKTKGNPALIVVGIVFAVIMFIGLIQGTFRPLGNLSEYVQEKVTKTFRLDPISVITAWRRDKPTYEKYFDDLRDQGWSDERIEALKFFTEIIPGVQDLIRMGVREAFDEDFVKKWEMDAEFYKMPVEWAEKLGYSREWSKYSWRAHWELPSVLLGYEMLHRDIIKPGELDDLMAALDIMPGWRKKLVALSWNIPTRVDVRRFWDMRTIDEARLREIYTALGYHGQDLEDYVLWTKIYTDFPDLLARYKNGWITIDQVKREIIAMGLSPERADTLIEEKIKKAAPERVATEKNLTKADIISGVKKGVITRGEGTVLLMDIGYDPVEADYILAVSIPLDDEDITVQKRELTKTDIIAGLKAGVITEPEALTKLIDLRYTTLDAQFILQIYKATITPPAETKAREASKADIVLAVKKGLITPESGYLMLQDIGFTPEAAQFILMVQAETSPFSPMSYQEFKDITGKWRKSAGVEATPEVEELRKAGAEVVKLTRDLAVLKASLTEEDRKLITAEGLPPEATKRRDDLRVTLHRAEAALAAAQSHYDALVAEWRHKA